MVAIVAREDDVRIVRHAQCLNAIQHHAQQGVQVQQRGAAVAESNVLAIAGKLRDVAQNHAAGQGAGG